MDDYDPRTCEFFGDSAKERLALCDEALIPKSITDAWVFDGGSFNGMIYYASFTCRSLDECWQAVRAFRSPDQSKFADGIHTAWALLHFSHRRRIARPLPSL